MTFLEKIKAKRAAENGQENASGAVKEAIGIVEKKMEETTATKKSGATKSPLAGILARKKAAEKAQSTNAVNSLLSEEKTTDKVKKEEKAAEAKEVVAEKTEAKVEEPKTVAEVPTKKEEKPEEVTAPAEATPAAEETATSEEKAGEEAPKKKTRRTRTKKVSAKKEDETADAAESKTITMLNAREFQIQNIIDTKMSFEEMVSKYESSFEDSAWLEFQEEIITELDSIRVAADMNPGTLRVTAAQLSDLDGKITVEHAKFKALLESLTNKEDGVCTCIRYQAMANGANENERRANGYAALSNANYKGQNINFVNLIAGTRMKYIFLDSIKQRIKNMQSICITFLGTMKIENSMESIMASAQ